MKIRCNYHLHPSFMNYGAKGIGYCPEWEQFDAFLWGIGERPEGMTLDRLNSTEGYSKSNCRWSDRATQNLNRNITLAVPFRGGTSTVKELSETFGIPYTTLRNRVRSGWSIETAITAPIRQTKKTVRPTGSDVLQIIGSTIYDLHKGDALYNDRNQLDAGLIAKAVLDALKAAGVKL